MMELFELQRFADAICERYRTQSVPLVINGRIKQFFGLAYHYENNWKIELSYSVMIQPDEIQQSIVIHELCHMILRQGHTKQFFALSEQIHREIGIWEDRTSKRHHGTVYNSEKMVVHYNYVNNFHINKKDYERIVKENRLSRVPD